MEAGHNAWVSEVLATLETEVRGSFEHWKHHGQYSANILVIYKENKDKIWKFIYTRIKIGTGIDWFPPSFNITSIEVRHLRFIYKLWNNLNVLNLLTQIYCFSIKTPFLHPSPLTAYLQVLGFHSTHSFYFQDTSSVSFDTVLALPMQSWSQIPWGKGEFQRTVLLQMPTLSPAGRLQSSSTIASGSIVFLERLSELGEILTSSCLP